MIDAKEVMLTTKDNPYNPFTHYEEWKAWDTHQGYNTSSYLARIANTSHELSEHDNMLEIERAIDEILRVNPLDIYEKVYEDSELN